MKNSIYVGSNTSAVVAPNGIVPLITIVHRENRGNGSDINLIGNAIAIETNCGSRPRYNFIAKITFTGAAAGVGTFSIYRNGVEIPFATGSETITTIDTEVRTVTIPASVLTNGCSLMSLTIVNTGSISVTVTDVSFTAVEQ